VTAAAAILVWLTAMAGMAAPSEVSVLLDRLGGDADVVLMSDPAAVRPAHMLLATRVAVSSERLRQVLVDPVSYGKAMPSFRRVEVMSRQTNGGMDVAWELGVPLWNLEGKLRLRPRTDGADLELVEGDFAPGVFHLTAVRQVAGKAERSLLVIEGHANVRDANVATRKLTQRSPLVEPAMTVAAVYVMLKSLARFAEVGLSARPGAAMLAQEPLSIDGAQVGKVAQGGPQGSALLMAVRSRADGRLARVEVAQRVAAPVEQTTGKSLRPESFGALPGWKKLTLAGDNLDACTDPATLCWAVQDNMPLFSLDGTWKIRPRPWRARMVAGDRMGALMGIDAVASATGAGTIVVLSEHPRLDRAGFVARKLIAAEPFLEHGLALALTLVDAVLLGPALAGR
jgi:hypothetical protein